MTPRRRIDWRALRAQVEHGGWIFAGICVVLAIGYIAAVGFALTRIGGAP